MKNEPENVLPPSLGIMFARTPPCEVSAEIALVSYWNSATSPGSMLRTPFVPDPPLAVRVPSNCIV